MAYDGPEQRRVVNRSWPAPAFAAWAACWIIFASVVQLGAPPAAAFIAAGLVGAALSLIGATPWRRLFVGCGFPLSFAVSGSAGAVPAWAWLLPLAMLALVYPRRAWRDAPIFPTPAGSLAGLARAVPLAAGAAVFDAGCGLGAGLVELRREYPHARLEGIEWSWPLWLAGAARCRYARVRRGDLWSADWSRFALVYLFQRPESMERAAAKASRELGPGAWLASLEFEIASLLPQLVLESADGRRLWLYRAPFRSRG
ncbi:MAG: class I SAM-dependent methyltransferase [Caldimonas sp.]